VETIHIPFFVRLFHLSGGIRRFVCRLSAQLLSASAIRLPQFGLGTGCLKSMLLKNIAGTRGKFTGIHFFIVSLPPVLTT
jgi:hypothetical protein